jgi:hypothetical protein
LSPNNNSIKSFNEKVKDLEKKLNDIEKRGAEDEDTERKLTEEEQEKQDRDRYQSLKKDYYQHDTDGKKCSISQCLLECVYFPDYELGMQTEDGEIFYDDPNLDPEFWGYDNALETRKKVAAMSPKQLEKYKQGLKWEYTEETKKAIAEGKRLYVKSGSYPAYDIPDASVQYYEYKT